jgi:hypothetical protein
VGVVGTVMTLSLLHIRFTTGLLGYTNLKVFDHAPSNAAHLHGNKDLALQVSGLIPSLAVWRRRHG